MGGATGGSPEENRGGHIPRATEHLLHCLQRYKQYTFNKEGGGGEDNDSWSLLVHCKIKWVVFNPF